MSKYLIAEISIMHLGDINEAKRLILSAKNAGADAVKGQAFDPDDIAKVGSMPLAFYEQCALLDEEIRELINFGADHEISIFFTILSPSKSWIAFHQRWQKIFANKWNTITDGRAIDSPDFIVSMNQLRHVPLKSAQILCATEYLKPINMELYDDLFEFYERPIGISHHNIMMNDLFSLINSGREIPIIEKHFQHGKPINFGGALYRDCMHAATPESFEHLAKIYKG